MLGAFDAEIKIGLVFYIYHGFLKQQFRSLLHCFHLFIVEHYEKIYSWLQIFEEHNNLKYTSQTTEVTSQLFFSSFSSKESKLLCNWRTCRDRFC